MGLRAGDRARGGLCRDLLGANQTRRPISRCPSGVKGEVGGGGMTAPFGAKSGGKTSPATQDRRPATRRNGVAAGRWHHPVLRWATRLFNPSASAGSVPPAVRRRGGPSRRKPSPKRPPGPSGWPPTMPRSGKRRRPRSMPQWVPGQTRPDPGATRSEQLHPLPLSKGSSMALLDAEGRRLGLRPRRAWARSCRTEFHIVIVSGPHRAPQGR